VIHSELPVWLQKALPATHYGIQVVFSRDNIREILRERHSLSRVDGLQFNVFARIPDHCWSCGGAYQTGVLTQKYEQVDTVRHVRRRRCRYYASSTYWDRTSSSPAVQTNVILKVTLRLSAE
jgi:hypothetical protein